MAICWSLGIRLLPSESSTSVHEVAANMKNDTTARIGIDILLAGKDSFIEFFVIIEIVR